MNIIMLGPPGAGKGTQAEALAKKLNVPQISTGNLFRDEIKNETELGKKISDILNSGKLVADDTTIEIFRQRLSQPDCQNGAILDGVPRTLNQALLMDKLFEQLNKKIDRVVYINLPQEEIVVRITGRWTCKKCEHVYHEKYNPPKTPGVCDFDQSPLYQREDQKEEAVKKRLTVYQDLTKPLINYYKNRGLLVEIDGNKSIENVKNEIFEKLKLTS
jgi:adenylate kinase